MLYFTSSQVFRSFTSPGMTGFDSVILVVAFSVRGGNVPRGAWSESSLRAVPTVANLFADSLVSKANRIAEGVMARLSLAPQFAMVA